MTAIPKGARVPADHKSPAQREAEGVETVEVEWRGMVFTIPADPSDWKATTTLAFEQGKGVSGVVGVLGPEQWDALQRKIDPTNREVDELFTLIAERMGMDTSGN